MKTQIINVPLGNITINRYQSDSGLDNEKMLEIASSIQQYRENGQKGLLELPTARKLESGLYELAFGRHRKAAFLHLYEEQGDAFFSEMPLNVMDLSDQQMLELMGIEQMHKRDVSILEIGETFHRYMTEFGKTSVETAEKFGKSDEYVRSAIRMLNLPEPAKEKMRSGDLNVSGGRALLTLTKVLPDDKEALADVMARIEEGERPEYVIDDELGAHEATKFIYEYSFPIAAKPSKHMPELTNKSVMQALDSKNNLWVRLAFSGYGCTIQEALEYLKLHLEQGTKNDDGETVSPLLIERFEHLLKTPACTACPWFAKVNGRQFCGWVPCYERKVEAKKLEILHQNSKETGIAILTSEDGKFTELNYYTDKHEKYFKKKGEDLRLKLGRKGYTNFPGINSEIGVVVVGKTYANWKKHEEQQKIERGEVDASSGKELDWDTRRRMHNIRESQVELFVWDKVTPVFSSVLAGVKSVPFLEDMIESMDRFNSAVLPESETDEELREKMSETERLNQARRLVVFYTLFEGINRTSYDTDKEQPVSRFAKELPGFADAWGVKLPKGFENLADDYDKAIQLEIDALLEGVR